MRKRANLSQEELAERSGLSVSAVRALERGRRRRPYPRTVRALIDALGLGAQDSTLLEAADAQRPAAEPVLPTARTRLIGRASDMAALVGQLNSRGARLLTLTGAGGVGKTRLALEIARQLAHSFADGVKLVSLAPVRDSALVLPTIAGSLGIPDMGGVSLHTAVRTYLRERQLLLLLDNVEHLLDAAPEIGWLLDAAPAMTVLATSRAPLHLNGEHIHAVEPLTIEHATELFTERAFQAGSNRGDPDLVHAICDRLDRLPLAIELAASRTRLLPLADLLAHLDRSHDLLAGGTRDLPARQRTLRDTIAWSYDLLTPDEQAMLQALTVFAGGWTVEAAAAVADLDVATTLQVLGRLLDASLITRQPDDDETRFTVLETVRVFALARAEANGVLPQVRARHAAHVVGFAEAALLGMEGPDRDAWFDRVHRERDNLRVAMRWLLDQGQADGCATVLFLSYWIISDQLGEYRRWAGEALSHESLGARARAGVLALYGFAVFGSDRAEAVQAVEEAVRLARGADDLRVWAVAVLMRGHLAMWVADNELAAESFIEAESSFRRLGATSDAATARASLASVTMSLGRPEEAGRILVELEAELRQAGGTLDLVVTLVYRGLVLIRLGDWDRAERLVREAMASSRRPRAGFAMIYAVHYLEIIAAHTGRPHRSARLAGVTSRLVEQFGPFILDRVVEQLTKQAVATVAAELGPDLFDALCREGQAMTWSQVVDLATDGSSTPGVDVLHKR